MNGQADQGEPTSVKVSFTTTLGCFVADEGAPTAVEYALLLAGIAMVIIVAVLLLGGKLSAFFQSVPGMF